MYSIFIEKYIGNTPHREHMNHSFSIYPIIGGQCFILKCSRTLNCIHLFILSIPGWYCLGVNCWCTCEHREAATHPINLSSYMPFWSFAILRPTPADFCHCLLDPVDKTCPVWCWAIWRRLHRGKRKKSKAGPPWAHTHQNAMLLGLWDWLCTVEKKKGGGIKAQSSLSLNQSGTKECFFVKSFWARLRLGLHWGKKNCFCTATLILQTSQIQP